MTDNLIKQPKGKPILFSLLTLLSGIVIGVGATLMLTPQKKPDPRQMPMEWISERMISHMIRKLEIPEEQRPEVREKLKPIITEHMAEIHKIRQEAQPKISAIIDEMNEEIMNELTEEQALAWQKEIDRMKEFFERMQKRGPKGSGRGDRRDGNRGPRDRDGRRGDRRGPRDPNSPDFRPRGFNGQRPPEGGFPPDGQPSAPPEQAPDRRQPMPAQPMQEETP